MVDEQYEYAGGQQGSVAAVSCCRKNSQDTVIRSRYRRTGACFAVTFGGIRPPYKGDAYLVYSYRYRPSLT
jgi:hypothetical protein